MEYYKIKGRSYSLKDIERRATLISKGENGSLSREAKDVIDTEDNFKWISENIIKDSDGK